ncbi:MAG TPA: pantetheine-phosphate adenylyltransferase [bacterium]|nr:pantetheine-phosphate adenylyltransferase [bacterium]
MPITAVCPGSFDPPTEGHLNIIERGLKLFDKVVVAVAVNSQKKSIFSTAERIELLKELTKGLKGVEVDSFEDKLLVDYARAKKAQVIFRGLRTIQDYEYEFQMALANKQIAPEIETVFMMTEAQFSHISSSLSKEIIHLGGPGKGMVAPVVEKKLKEKFKKM